MQFQKIGLTVTAFQMMGVTYLGRHRYPAYCWIVRGWFDDAQVVMRAGEFRRLFGDRKAA